MSFSIIKENEYLSVTEYAALVGKNVSRVRRLAQSGRLPAVKIGSQWVIRKDAPYPEDNRIVTGKYVKPKP